MTLGMKKLFAGFAALILFAGCGGGVGGGSSTPPTATAVTISTTLNGAVLMNQAVVLSSSVSGTVPNAVPMGVIATQSSGSSGQTTFSGLTAGATYCWTATYQPSGGSQAQRSTCTNSWGGGGGITLAF